MKKKGKIIIACIVAIICILAGISIGSVDISVTDIIKIICDKIFNTNFGEAIPKMTKAILWNIRLPRTLLAFLVGAALSVSGAVLQSMLKNPLASPYTLGVSSGASLGAGIVVLTNTVIASLGMFTMPIMGIIGGVVTMLAVIIFSSAIDRNFGNTTIVLVGMVVSLFVNSVLTLLSAFFKSGVQRLVLWQMGSFSFKEWSHIWVLFPVTIIGVVICLFYNRELDTLTFGEEEAVIVGVEVKSVKRKLFAVTTILTGVAISFVGIVGFVDLVIPHITRRIFGNSHRHIIPMSALCGGAFMVVADLIARTVISPSELPVGAITALVGAPFFAYIYFSKRHMSY